MPSARAAAPRHSCWSSLATEFRPVNLTLRTVCWSAWFVCFLAGTGPAAIGSADVITESVPTQAFRPAIDDRADAAGPRKTATRQEPQDPEPPKAPAQNPVKSDEPKSVGPTQDDKPESTQEQRPMTERERMIAEANRRRLEEKEDRPDKPEIRRTADAGQPLELTFDDIKFDMDKNEEFQRSLLTDQIKSYHGKVVRLRGFIRPGARQENLSRFVFVRDDKECCFGPGAAIYDCVLVQMDPDHLTDFTVRPITLEGQFYLKEYKGPDGRVWAIYRMKNAKRQ